MDMRNKGISLLDRMAVQMQCMYLSDLRYLTVFQRIRLGCFLETIETESADLNEWNDATEYLTGERIRYCDAGLAKSRLIAFLSGSYAGR